MPALRIASVLTLFCVGLVVAGPSLGPAFAQARTTPVEVTNPVEIDPTANTVRAQQSGGWEVGILGTPGVAQAGTWNVGILGTPGVNVVNSPTVSIDPANNTIGIDANNNSVKTSTQSQMIQAWSGDQTLSSGQGVFTPLIDCRGYKELRGMFMANFTLVGLKVRVYAKGPSGAMPTLGSFNFGTTTQSISSHANFVPDPGRCLFVIPVMADIMRLYVINETAFNVTLYESSWIYLVN